MHASVIEARAVRDRENDRRRHNKARKTANALVGITGYRPAFMPAPTGENRAIRQEKNREERRMRRFFKNLVFVFS